MEYETPAPEISKAEKYELLILQVKALTEEESNQMANLANAAAALKSTFNWLWVGFYLVEGEELVLGPFQGPVACTRIPKGKGVCGTAWADNQTQLVPDVHTFPGHIACSPLSQSEVVVPLRNAKGEVWGVLDIDSQRANGFDSTDKSYLEKLAQVVN